MTRLGLTLCQAKIYLALAQSEASTIKSISNVSRVAREHVYRIINSLQKLGLVEKVIAKPIKFKAIPMHDAVSILLQRRINETTELQEKTRKMLQRFKEKKPKKTLQEEETQFVLIPKGMIARTRKKLIATAQESIDVVTTFRRHVQAVFTHSEDYRKALERGVRMRHIAEIPEDEDQLAQARKTDQAFREHPLFEVKYFRAPIPTVVALVDKKEVLIFTVPTLELEESDALFSTNPSLIEVAQHYFEIMWITSLKGIPEESHVSLNKM
jgi:sugar-specific transcriptional regulator TrmB